MSKSEKIPLVADLLSTALGDWYSPLLCCHYALMLSSIVQAGRVPTQEVVSAFLGNHLLPAIRSAHSVD